MKKVKEIKTRIIAVALVFALVISSMAMISPDARVYADEKDDEPWYNTEDGADYNEKGLSIISTLIKSDGSLKDLISLTENTVELLSKQIPAIGTFATPFIKMLCALYTDEKPELTLDDISKQMESLSDDLENAKKDLIYAMSSANDMTEFVNTFNAFNNSFKEMNHQISHISGYENFTREEKEKNLAELIGPRKNWTLTDNVVAKLDALGCYLCGETKLTSGNSDIYSVVTNHYSKTVCFGREAMNKTDSFITDTLAIYLEGTSQLINCILAERSFLLRNGTNNDLCDAEYCVTKIKEILTQINKVNQAITNYRQNTSPVTFYDRSEGAQKNINMQEYMGLFGFNGKVKLDDALPAGKTLSSKQMEYILKYAKDNYSNMSLQEFLDYMGFKFMDNTYIDWKRSCEMNKDQYIGYLRGNGLNAELVEYLNLCINPTEENYRKVGLYEAKDKYMMIDKGYDKTYTNMFGYCSTYYYKGVQLQDKQLTIQDKPYYYERGGSDKENKADAAMFYLLRK